MAKGITFGRRVRALRTVVPDLSQRELDSLAGLHQGHVWQIEEGHRENPTRETLSGLRQVFGASSDWLLDGVGDPPDDEAVIAAVEIARAKHAKPRAASGAR